MIQYKKFDLDLRKKFLLIGIVPIFVVSAFLLGKIYFILEDISQKSHIRVLKDIDFNIDSLFKEIKDKTKFIEENFQNTDIEEFIKAIYEIETILIYNKKEKKIEKFVSNLDITDELKRRYLKENPIEKFKKIKKPGFGTVHTSINGKSKTISYVVSTKDYIFIFDVNLSIIKSYIDYIKQSVDYIIVVVDNSGKYIFNTSKERYFHSNFFSTEYYKKVVKKYKPLEYVEFFNEEQDVDNFMVYYKSRDTGWILATIEDFDSLDDEVIGLIPFVVFLIPFVILVIILLSKKFTSKIVIPLEILINKMEKLSNMKDVQKIELDDVEYSLFKRIIDSFNMMQDRILKREEELKKSNELLRKKTKEISLLNESLQDKVAEEIEKNRKKDQQMLQQSRLAQMGEMISMIAHQWRQPLSAISSASMTLNIQAKLNKVNREKVLDLTAKILDYSQHLSSTIDDFREFFKANKEKKETTYSKLILSVLNIIETSLVNKNIKLIKNIENEKVIYTYPNELKQVILNLIKNAEDVLLDRNIENPTITISVIDNKLSIEDNAGGIPEDIIDKIFDPYFSTKTKKDGTGLGLYMSKTIVEEHCGGKLLVKNSGEGAVFTIVL